MLIGLLQCDHVDEALVGINGDYDVMFPRLFDRIDSRFTWRVYDVIGGELPESTEECDGFLITGSSFSVYEDFVWIRDLERFIVALNAAQKKLVGICFGHQLIARALGGESALSEKGWGAGLKKTELVGSAPWIDGKRESDLRYTHQDQVLRLPEGAELLASNEHCECAMYRIGSHIFCIQGHPEFTRNYAVKLLESRIVRIPSDVYTAAIESLSGSSDSLLVARWIDRFFRT